MVKVSSKAQKTIEKYGVTLCLKAYRYNLQGEGARSIYQECLSGLANTQAADAAINAGREYTVATHGEESIIAVDGAIAKVDELNTLQAAYARTIGHLRRQRIQEMIDALGL